MKPIQDDDRAHTGGRIPLGFLLRRAFLSVAIVAAAVVAFSGVGPATAASQTPLDTNGGYSLTTSWDLFPYYSPGDIEVIPSTGEVFVWDNLGIERLSPSGQLLERYDGLPDGSTAVDSAGNLLIAERYSDVPEVRTVSPSGQLLSVLAIPDLFYAGPLATLGNSTWVGVQTDQGVALREYANRTATGRIIPITDATFLVSPGFWYGDNMVGTPEGNLTILVRPTSGGSDPLVRTYSPDGHLVSEWNWRPSAPDALPHSGSPGALAVGPQGQVFLLGDDGAGGRAFLEVFTPTGSLQQRINLSTLHGQGRPAGITVDGNGRVYATFTSYQEGGRGKVFLFDALRPPSIAPLSWNATMCSPFEDRIVAGGTPAPSRFEVVDGSLPAGLSLNQSTGVISGIPSHSGETKGIVRASNGVDPSAETPFTFAVTAPRFDSTAAPALRGEALEGKTLTVDNGTWSPAPQFAYQWFRDGRPIDGAIYATYTVSSADVGHEISARLQATGDCGREATVSTSGIVPVTIVKPSPTAGPGTTPTDMREPTPTPMPASVPEMHGNPATSPAAPSASSLAATGLNGIPTLWAAVGLATALAGTVLVLAARRRKS